MSFSKLLSSVRLTQNTINYGRVAVRACSCGGGSGSDPSDGGGKGGLVLGVYASADGGSFEMTAAAREFDQRSGGQLCRHLAELSCQMKLGAAFVVPGGAGAGAGEDAPTVAVASLGPREPGYNTLERLDEGRENVRWAVGAGVALLAARGQRRVAVDPCGAPDAAAEAATLAAWRFQEFKSCGGREPETSVSLYTGGGGGEGGGGGGEGGGGGGEGGGEAARWREGALRGAAQNWARHLSDMPANKMAPVDLAQEALNVLCPLGVRVEARDRDWIEAQSMRAFLAVARGSCETPIFLEAAYDGGSGPPVLLAAKGVTFDSGGLCLKRPESMCENRGSMAGAAAVLGAVRAVAELKVPINVRCVIPLCENMVSGQCMKVGDVVPALNGLNIQVENTDMEGRLMLADALVYGQARHKPALVVDVATLTHGILLATGGGAFGCFSNCERAWEALQLAGALSGDRPWRFPLWNYYHKQLTDDLSVDLRNEGSGKATPCLGAAFLRNFVCGEWVHLDITGVGKLAHAPAPPYLHPRRMTGRPTRTLLHFLQGLPPPPSPQAAATR